MSQPENLPAKPDGCGDNVAAYALGALDPGEVEVFQAHLEACAICRDELAAFQQVVDLLPMSAPAYRAPRRLRRQLMAAVRADAKSAGPAPERRGGPAWSRLRVRGAPRIAAGLATAVIALIAGGLALQGSGTPSIRTVTAQVTGVSGRAVIRISQGHAELIVRDFSPPPSGQIYEVWLQRPGRRPAPTTALFSVNSHGAANADVPGDLHGVSQVMVTPEPAGGSRVPTHSPVIRAQLT